MSVNKKAELLKKFHKEFGIEFDEPVPSPVDSTRKPFDWEELKNRTCSVDPAAPPKEEDAWSKAISPKHPPLKK